MHILSFNCKNIGTEIGNTYSSKVAIGEAICAGGATRKSGTSTILTIQSTVHAMLFLTHNITD